MSHVREAAVGREEIRCRHARPHRAGAIVLSTVLGLWGATSVTPFAAVARAGTEPPCHGAAPTLVGTDGDDQIHGTDGPDVILALGGDDSVESGSGNDIVCLGPGNDAVFALAGRDLLIGGPGDV